MGLQRMKKLLALSLVFCLGCSALNGCTKNEGRQNGTAVSEEGSTVGEVSSRPDAEEAGGQPDGWKKAYLAVLDDLSDRQADNRRFCFAVRDIDGDGIPELIITKNGMDTRIYTWRDKQIVKAGHHDFKSGTTRFLVSEDSSCPGIFVFSVGGGYEWYEYMTIKDGTLAIEDLWNKDYSGISKILGKKRGKIEKASSDEKLIAESKKAYKKESDLTFKEILPRNYKDLKEGE